MVRMNLRELNIHQNKKNYIDLLSCSPYVELEGSVSSIDIQEVYDMFCKWPIYLLTEEEANEYLALKHAEEVRNAETKEEESNEE